MMTVTAAVGAILAAIASLLTTIAALVSAAVSPLISAGLTAGLAVTRVALFSLEMASASAPAAATAILTLLGIFPFAAGLAGGLGLWRSRRRATEEFLYPGEEAA